MTTQPDTEITLPPDRDLGAMVESIQRHSQPAEVSAGAVRIRLAVIHGTAERLAVALEREQGVMGEMAKALEEAHAEAVEAEECWRIGCLRDQNHAATRSNRNVAVRVATHKALAKYEARRVP